MNHRTISSFVLGSVAIGLLGCQDPFGATAVEVAQVRSVTSAVDNTRRYGTFCQQDFALNAAGQHWQDEILGAWSTCANFNTAMNKLAPQAFYFTLHGAAPFFLPSNDGQTSPPGGVDTVDLLYTNTHGGAFALLTPPPADLGVNATVVMFENEGRALSTFMRLGNNSRGLSAWANLTCNILSNADGRELDRWSNAFDGGLKILAASHDKVQFNGSVTSHGTRFADNLRAGQTVRMAWKNALSGTSLDNDAAVVATGANWTDCSSRLNNINWTNLTSTPKLQDWGWVQLCQDQWDNL
jgi:Family of unknown function (DUF6345)